MFLAQNEISANWQESCKPRITTPDEAVKAVKSGDRVFLTGNASVPLPLLDALVRRAPQLKDVEVCHPLTICPDDYVAPEMQGHLRINSMFISANVRKAINEGRADFTPVMLSEFPLLFKNGHLPLDVAMIHVSPPDENGYCSMGAESGLTISAAEVARIVIAQPIRVSGRSPAKAPGWYSNSQRSSQRVSIAPIASWATWHSST